MKLLAAFKFSVSLLLQFVANAVLFSFLASLSVPVWPAQLTTTIALTAGNYLVYRYWVFK